MTSPETLLAAVRDQLRRWTSGETTGDEAMGYLEYWLGFEDDTPATREASTVTVEER